MKRYYIKTANNRQFLVEQLVDRPLVRWSLSNNGLQFEIGKSDYGKWHKVGPIITTTSIGRSDLDFDVDEIGKLIDELPLTLEKIRNKLLEIGMTYFVNTEIKHGTESDTWILMMKGVLQPNGSVTNDYPVDEIHITFCQNHFDDWYNNGFSQRSVAEEIEEKIKHYNSDK